MAVALATAIDLQCEICYKNHVCARCQGREGGGEKNEVFWQPSNVMNVM